MIHREDHIQCIKQESFPASYTLFVLVDALIACMLWETRTTTESQIGAQFFLSDSGSMESFWQVGGVILHSSWLGAFVNVGAAIDGLVPQLIYMWSKFASWRYVHCFMVFPRHGRLGAISCYHVSHVLVLVAFVRICEFFWHAWSHQA